MNKTVRASVAQLTPAERTAWTTAVLTHQNVKRLQDECHDAQLDGQAVREALDQAEQAVLRLIMLIEGM